MSMSRSLRKRQETETETEKQNETEIETGDRQYLMLSLRLTMISRSALIDPATGLANSMRTKAIERWK